MVTGVQAGSGSGPPSGPRLAARVAAVLLVLAVTAAVVVVVTLGERRSPPQDPLADRPDRSVRSTAAGEALRRLRELIDAGEPAPDGASQAVATATTNARRLGVTRFSLRHLQEDAGALTSGSQEWTAGVQTAWSLGRIDRGRIARVPVTFTFRWEGERARIVGIGGGGRRTPLWLAGPLAVRRAPGVLVLAAEQGPDPDRYLRLAVRATRQVRELLSEWSGGLTVEIPADSTQLGGTLDTEPSAYGQIAAVTTTVDGSPASRSPAHVFVNPDVFDPLAARGAQVVLTHEAVHVATGAATSDLPRWLVEGFADYVALRDVPLPTSITAAQVAAVVRADGVPDRLPRDADFGAKASHLGAAYEAAWLACRTLAAAGSEAGLVAYYEAVRRGAGPAVALRRTLGLTYRDFVSAWQDRLEAVAR